MSTDKQLHNLFSIDATEPLPDTGRGLRFPFDLPLQFRAVVDGDRVMEGSGRTVDISAGGMLFSTMQPPVVGSDVELLIPWPVLFEGFLPMQLRVAGGIVRSQEDRAALRICSYEFLPLPANHPHNTSRMKLS